jgi:type IV pilus assembly protein PilW
LGGTVMKGRSSLNPRMQGLSLVELMVALTIGLIILAGVSTLFVNSKKTYTTQDRMALLQENARFAMQFLIKDLRLAGYYGCVDEINSETVHNAVNSSSFAFDLGTPIEGLSNVSGSVATPTGTWYPSTDTTLPSNIKLGTDAIALRMQDTSSGVEVRDEMPNESAEIKVTAITGIQSGDILMISDCKSADVFQVTATNGSALAIQHNTGIGTPGNKNPPDGWLSKSYAPPAQIMKFITRRYYIRDNDSGIPALYRRRHRESENQLWQGHGWRQDAQHLSKARGDEFGVNDRLVIGDQHSYRHLGQDGQHQGYRCRQHRL